MAPPALGLSSTTIPPNHTSRPFQPSLAHLPILAKMLTQMNNTLTALLHLWILTKTAPFLPYRWNLYPANFLTATSKIVWLDPFTKHGMIMSFHLRLIPTPGPFKSPSPKNVPATKHLNVKAPNPSIASTLTLCKILSAMVWPPAPTLQPFYSLLPHKENWQVGLVSQLKAQLPSSLLHSSNGSLTENSLAAPNPYISPALTLDQLSPQPNSFLNAHHLELELKLPRLNIKRWTVHVKPNGAKSTTPPSFFLTTQDLAVPSFFMRMPMQFTLSMSARPRTLLTSQAQHCKLLCLWLSLLLQTTLWTNFLQQTYYLQTATSTRLSRHLPRIPWQFCRLVNPLSWSTAAPCHNPRRLLQWRLQLSSLFWFQTFCWSCSIHLLPLQPKWTSQHWRELWTIHVPPNWFCSQPWPTIIYLHWWSAFPTHPCHHPRNDWW